MLNTISENEKQSINTFETVVNKLEDTIFGGGPFSAHLINEKLETEKLSESLGKARREKMARINSSGLEDFAKSMGLGQKSYSTASLSQKKDYYIDTFNKFDELIIPIRDGFIILCKKFPENERIKKLLERSEKCVKELDNLRKIVRNFN